MRMKNFLYLAFHGFSTVYVTFNAQIVQSYGISEESDPGIVSTSEEGSNTRESRNLEDLELACDQAFFQCFPIPDCASCFLELKEGDIDWTTVTDDTPCRNVTEILFDGGHCTGMKGKEEVIDTFCKTYDVCVPWYRAHNKDKLKPAVDNATDVEIDIDCSSLTECSWDGFHRGFLGDGICHENYPGCYNTEICNFDGGDCCEDKCSNKTLVECGHDGYACRDPSSRNCDSSISKKCTTDDKDDDDTDPVCASNETSYRIVMFDSFGDGWDSANITISESDGKTIFSGSLESGGRGTQYICLSLFPSCYNIKVNGGIWGNEISWEIRPLSEGAKPLADGASPMDCNFSIAGDSCERTCTGKSNTERKKDSNYKSFEELSSCINEKCLIQKQVCVDDALCSKCLNEQPGEYCFADDNFNSVVDCSLCQCTDNHNDFCDSKHGTVTPSKKKEDPGKKPCTPSETLKGSSALMTFTQCSNFDEVGAMVTDFDTNNFGDLDTFEACAHSYNNDVNHGGRTAMQCMQILYDSMNSGRSDDDDNSPPYDAIAALAGLVYNDGQNFCDCASEASAECPLCPNFIHFKTLLYESLDACKALDEIDCNAWEEFYPKCKSNIESKFEKADFSKQAQCDFVQKSNCDAAGFFPAFRRLDCESEISKASWEFYNLFLENCLKADDGNQPDETPASPAPTPPTSPSTVFTLNPTEEKKKYIPEGGGGSGKKYIPEGGGGSGKKYIPEGGSGSKEYTPSDDDETGGTENVTAVETSHFWRNISVMGLLGAVIYFYYKRNNESFPFTRYRRIPRNFGVDGNTLYNGLTMESGASTFEPPSLPLPPSAMNNQPQHYHPQQQNYSGQF